MAIQLIVGQGVMQNRIFLRKCARWSVLYEGAEHRLDECAAELDQLLTQWIPATLRAAVSP